jgi:alkylation response protein AidB-like acyl-CoA dehydrogenase
MSDENEDGQESPELREYRRGARAWLREAMKPLARDDQGTLEDPDGVEPSAERVRHARAMQKKVFAGITFPVECGGQGLTLDHERIFEEEAVGYDMPTRIFAYSINILGATLVAFGSH